MCVHVVTMKPNHSSGGKPKEEWRLLDEGQMLGFLKSKLCSVCAPIHTLSSFLGPFLQSVISLLLICACLPRAFISSRRRLGGALKRLRVALWFRYARPWLFEPPSSQQFAVAADRPPEAALQSHNPPTGEHWTTNEPSVFGKESEQ